MDRRTEEWEGEPPVNGLVQREMDSGYRVRTQTFFFVLQFCDFRVTKNCSKNQAIFKASKTVLTGVKDVFWRFWQIALRSFGKYVTKQQLTYKPQITLLTARGF